MASFIEGVVAEVLEERPELVRAMVTIEDREVETVGYPRMLGPLEAGDSVIVNMTGVELSLGTGGIGFILWNLDAPRAVGRGEGHIVKMNYTPWQTEVMAVEAPESDGHDLVATADTIRGIPVVACGLHSQVPAVAAGIQAAMPDARVGYLMTDGAALPLAWSNLVRRMKQTNLIHRTCTAGHAFGGDLEAVNDFSGMVALRWAGECDAIVASLGPGVIGTDTLLGFSAIEQGRVLDAATALGGQAVACLRLSFADERDRHRGISHHTITALTVAARERATLAVPTLPPDRADYVEQQLRTSGLAERHEVVYGEGDPGVRLLRKIDFIPSTMNRSMEDDPEPFLAACAAGAVAATLM